jgi:rhodanese-related sulfurtransferase
MILRALPLGLFIAAAYLVWESRRGKKSRIVPMKRQCAVILLITLLLGGTYHLLAPTGLLRNPAAAKIVTGRFASSGVPELSHAETKERLKSGEVLLFDTRPAEKFAEGTIPGAVNFPMNSTLPERETLLADVPRSMPVILFCKTNRCPYADDIARFLRFNGYENVAIYRDGYSKW